MNINELTQKPNIENQTMQNIQNYSAMKNNSNDFSYYVEVSKIKEIKNTPQENPDDNTQAQTEDELLLQENQNTDNTANIAFAQSVQNLNSSLFDLGINEKNNFYKDINTYNINLTDLNLNDIKLFESLTEKHDISINSFNSQNQTFNMVVNGENLNISYRSIEISKTLFTAIENASKTGKPIRLDFGNDTSVILKIGKDGKLSADFIPNDKAMEAMLKNALPELRAKFEEENIPYGELNYKHFNQQKQNKKEDNKEKKDE